jgi:hypothetical protein
MHNPAIVAAVIAAAVSALGFIVTLLTTRWQLRSKMSELEQTQLKDVLTKRMDAYPKLWCIVQTYVSNWNLTKKPRDAAWASNFLSQLNACHAEYGVFFSQPVYERFFTLRGALIAITAKLSANQVVSNEELDSLETIYSGHKGMPGLATQLKADLGSYRPTIFVQAQVL